MTTERHLPIFIPRALTPAGERAASGFGALFVTPESAATAALPVRALDVHAKVAGLTSHTRVVTRFVNIHPVELRATYIFPLPAGAAVTSFKMRSQGREIVGKVFERGEAIQRHEDAILRGKTSALLEEEASETFTLEVGNIPPNCEIETELTLVELVPVDDRRASWRFPLVCGEKYIPGAPLPGEQTGTGTWSDTTVVPEGSRLNPPRLLPGMPNPIELGVTVELAEETVPEGAVVDATLPLMSERVARVDGPSPRESMTLVLDPGLASPDRDLILRWQLPGERPVNDLRVVREGEHAGTFVATLVMPDSGAKAPPRDVVMLVDRSGSMAGWPMELAKDCASHLVDQLRNEDRFAILAFDDVAESFMPDPTLRELFEATDHTRALAREFIHKLEARGGTELGWHLARCLETLSQEQVEGREQAIILVTDAQVGDERRILAMARKQAKPVPVYVVGIDTSLNRGLLDRLVRGSGGHLAQIARPEDRDEALATVSSALAKSVVRDVQLEAAGGLSDISPRTLPPLVPGVPFRVAGRFLAGEGAASLGVRAQLPEGETLTLELPARAGEAETVAPVWAKLLIADLQVEHDQAAHEVGDSQEAIEKRIVELSCTHQLLSRFTAYLAIDEESDVKVGGEIQVTQPVTELLMRRLYAAHPSLEILEDIGPFSTVSSEARPGVASLGAEDELEEALETFGCLIEQIESRRELFELAREESGIIRVILRTVMKQGNELMKNAAAALYSAMNLAPWESADDQERFLEAWKAFCTAVGKSSKALSRAEKRHWT